MFIFIFSILRMIQFFKHVTKSRLKQKLIPKIQVQFLNRVTLEGLRLEFGVGGKVFLLRE